MVIFTARIGGMISGVWCFSDDISERGRQGVCSQLKWGKVLVVGKASHGWKLAIVISVSRREPLMVERFSLNGVEQITVLSCSIL